MKNLTINRTMFANTNKYESTGTLKFKLRRKVGFNMPMSVQELNKINKLLFHFCLASAHAITIYLN